jgi:AmmeMemoRadiSam system protein A
MGTEHKPEDIVVALARNAITAFLRHGHAAALPEQLPVGLDVKAGAFVSLKRRGQLRGCMGTYEPMQLNLAHEIIENAVSAATRDPRFPPVEEWEIGDLDVSVDILGPCEKVDGLYQLDARRYGVVVKSGSRTGLLLPDLEGVDTPEDQVAICMQKAGIRPGEPILFFRFTVERHR